MRKTLSFGLLLFIIANGFLVVLKAGVGLMYTLYPESELPREAMYYARNWYMAQVFVFLWAIDWAHKRRMLLKEG